MRKFEKDLKQLHEINKTTKDLTLFATKLEVTDIEYLEAKGLIETKGYNDFNYEIRFTNKGLTYFDDKQIKRKEYFLKSFVTPAIVAFITTIIINYVIPWIADFF
ncbi:hypothetical protein AB6883_12835 [Carnobacterium maltaromaticum]|uniref:hypothetical protein n=1 Tax=Carnobacterium maltaromaticum TaxID=2751 RepID=UPI00026C8627|nr:hypothetical protein [Carnobacterium maltaromaticum]MDT1943356.1 hypothetical protein [Carnobacterium maltaromaticum]MDT1998736.1 hypothetical protein [Carnobacterium maltaromaticum]